jgi:hypothetical protein
VLKGKEVISDPQRQYDVAWRVHSESHGGINKTTATITENYHWVRIKDTVTQVIKNCAHCKEAPARALAPYGRREGDTKADTIAPFEREFSVPPGEKALWAHGFSADGMPIEEPAPATPRADDDEPRQQSFEEPDNTAADATFGALMATADSIMPNFPEFPHDDSSVPVDPELMNGNNDTPTNFHHLEEEVRRLQRTQLFDTPIFETGNSGEVQQQSVDSSNNRRTSRRANANAPVAQMVPSTTPSQANSTQPQSRAQQTPRRRNELDSDVIYVSNAGPATSSTPQPTGKASAPGSKRKGPPGEPLTGTDLRRVTRRLAAGNTGTPPGPGPQAGYMSEDDWRKSLNSG